MSIRIDERALDDVMRLVRRVGDDAKLALSRTINGVLTSTRAKSVQLIGRELNLPARRIRQDFSIVRARVNDLTAKVKCTSKPVELIHFIGTAQRQDGVSVKIKRNGGRRIIRHAYISARGQTQQVRRRIANLGEGAGRGRIGFFARLPWNHPMKKSEILTGPRVADIYDDPGVINPVQEYAGQRLVIIAQQQVNRLLGEF